MPLYFKKSAIVISVSKLTSENFRRLLKLPSDKIRTVYFGPASHFRRINDEPSREAVRNRYGLPQRFILTLSKPHGEKRKNLAHILEAYSRYRDQAENPLALVVAGLDDGIPSSDSGASDDARARDVIFTGWIDQQDLPAVYSLADLFLYPSNLEAFPIPITEAMACGTPIVTSNVNGLEEIAGDAAILVDPTDVAEITGALQRLLNDPELQASLSARGHSRAKGFSWLRCGAPRKFGRLSSRWAAKPCREPERGAERSPADRSDASALMTGPLAIRAGNALLWRAGQLAAIKIVFLVRLLILARILVPDAFGLVAVAVIPIELLLSATDLGMVPALVQRREARSRHYDVAWTIGVLRALCISGLVLLTAPLFAELAGEPRATNIIRALALRPLLEAVASIKIADLIRRLEFRSIAGTRLTEAVLNTAVSIALAPFLGVWALVVGTLAGTSAYVVASYLVAPYRPRLTTDRETTIALVRFGRWIFASALLAVIGGAALKLVISRQLGTLELGLYFLAARLAFLPAELAAEVAGSVAFPLYAGLQTDLRKVSLAFRANLAGLAALLLPVIGLIIALAPPIVEQILGPSWEGTAPIIRILAMVSAVGLLGDVAVPILKGLGQPSRETALEGIQTLVLLLLVWPAAAGYGLAGAALAWLPAVGLSQCLSVMFLRQALPRPFSGLGAALLVILVSSVAGAVAAWVLSSAMAGVGGLFLAGLAGAITSLSLLAVGDRWFQLRLAENLNRAFPQFGALLPFLQSKD